MAGTAALGSYILSSIAGIKPEDYVILDSWLVKNKGDAYYNAMERFRNGATLMYDGVAFGFRPNNEIARPVRLKLGQSGMLARFPRDIVTFLGFVTVFT